MKRRTEIDLNKMSAESRNLYLQDLLEDSLEALKDLVGAEPRYDYINATMEHLEQAVFDFKQRAKQ
jgi:hypothetical protein